jgi:MoaA/NifB/PqqE/SkfB family radical SAM enzyme
MKFKDLIYTSKICPLPWVGAMVKPVGTFSSCCVQDDRITNPYSSLENNSLQEVRNNDYWKQLRKDLINGIEHPSCKDCWHLEKNGNTSLRQIRLDEFKYFLGDKLLELEVHDDGSLSDETIYFWDVRQTNLCNMKCIMCGPDYSSLWREELIRQHGQTGNAVIDANQISKEDFFLDIQKGILDVEQFYFAGGEPLISDTHWKILELLIQNNRTDVRLSYNTNLLKTTFKGKNVLDYWKQFNSVRVGVSIDCIGTRAEYVRYGTNWKTVNDNFILLNSTLPDSTALNVTTNILSIGGLVDTIAWAKQFSYKNEEHDLLVNNLVYSPEYLNIKILPQPIKDRIWKNLVTVLSELKDKRSKAAIEAELFNDVDSDHLYNLRHDFYNSITKLDYIRNTNVKYACPELADWIDELKDVFGE